MKRGFLLSSTSKRGTGTDAAQVRVTLDTKTGKVSSSGHEGAFKVEKFPLDASGSGGHAATAAMTRISLEPSGDGDNAEGFRVEIKDGKMICTMNSTH